MVLPESSGLVFCFSLLATTGDLLTSKAPNHSRIRDTNGERCTRSADERVRRVQTCPDDDTNIAVHEEFLEKEVPLVRLVGVRE